ncbi:mandelate racemase/muconate lactonizing enzyme family protein [Nocardioides kribbensis]|uniref:mandelate racemase/muconate lactonizing enzyme family protein n=1 Tax=Nocardioides kribbensis TaxID=305517 RepID=UPI0029D41CCA|nr:mandelate racemase/muconate lactonizing enzyme family protein [Nocardioides kribbensis]
MRAVVTGAEALLVDLPVEQPRTDAVQSFVKQETVMVELTTDDGASGLGYSYTIGTGGTAVLAMLRDHLLPALVGQDAERIEAVWARLLAGTRATAVGAITSLALAAIDTALWDRRCRTLGLPLWVLAGGAKDRIRVYDTESGWLHLPLEELVTGCATAVAAGAGGVKVKIGRPSRAEDAERLQAVRDAIGPHAELMVDANQAFDLGEALLRARDLEAVGAAWFEEPLPADDVRGHERLAAATSVPVAVGESLYSPGQFAEYLARGAATVVQPDVARVGGITPWLRIAQAAQAHHVPVCPHFLMELHVSLCGAVGGSGWLEHIPQLRAITRDELRIQDGSALMPEHPGLGIDWDRDAIDGMRVA